MILNQVLSCFHLYSDPCAPAVPVRGRGGRGQARGGGHGRGVGKRSSPPG